jgi:hypothetical protein
MKCTVDDIPRENLFLVGIVQRRTTRDFLVIRRPRRPFAISRAEALNLFGYMLTHADWTVPEMEQAIAAYAPEQCFCKIDGDDRRVLIDFTLSPPHASVEDRARWAYRLLTMDEAKILCAALVHTMRWAPEELDAAVVAIFEHARNADGTGQSLADMLKG